VIILKTCKENTKKNVKSMRFYLKNHTDKRKHRNLLPMEQILMCSWWDW